MKTSFKKLFMVIFTLMVLTLSALGVTPAYATWVFNNKTTTNGLGSNTVKSVFVNGNTVYAGTTGGLSISTDGGATFINHTDLNLTVNGVFASGGNVYAATNFGLDISTNGGTTFPTTRLIADGLGDNTVQDVFVSGSNVYAATNGGLSISSNSGTSFTNKTIVDGLGNNQINGVFVDGTTVYAATGNGLSISTDGGTTFTSNKTISDGLGSNTVNKVFVNGSNIYAATDGGVSISTDGGSTFNNKTDGTNGLGNNLVKGISVSGGTIYAATAAPGVATNSGLSISTDGGNTFSNKTIANGLGNNRVRGVFTSGSTVYAATDGGLSIGADIDITAPTINSFTASSPVANFNIPITAFTASDDFGVTGYLITQSSTPPLAGAVGWSGTAPTTYTVTSNGSYTLYPWAKDAAGNVSAVYGTPASVTVLDNTAPNTTIDSQPSTPSTNTTPSFTFSGNDGAGSGVASFKCKIDGDAFASCTSPFTTSSLSNGSHTFSVKATDNAGNEDASPASYTWTVDTIAPDTTILGQPGNPDNDNTPSFTFSGNDGAGSGIASFMCNMDGGAFASCSSPFTSSVLLDGSHTFSVKATDNVGNEDATPASYTWTIDIVGPTVSSIVCTGACTTAALSVDFTVTFSKSVLNVDTGDFTLNATGVGGASITGISGSGSTYTVTVGTGTGNGTVHLDVPNTASITDLLGNPVVSLPYTSGETYTINKGITTPPLAPTLASPAENQLITDYTPTLDWGNSTIPVGSMFDHYQIQVATDAAFSSPVTDVNIPGLFSSIYTIPSDLASNTKYYWHVRGVNLAGGIGNWSATRTFRTIVTAPALLSPVDNADAVSLRPSFDWTDITGPGAVTGYTIQISKNNLFTQVVHTGSPVVSNYIPTVDLPKNIQLFWRVQTKGSNGPSAWSAVRSLNSANSPTTPSLSLPAANALNTDFIPLFKWTAVTLPVGTTFQNYQLQVADNVNFVNPVIDDSSITTITNILSAVQFTPSAPLAHNTKYYWRVRAVNTNNEEGGWSAVRYFRTIVDAPVLVSPIDDFDALTLRPAFDWDDVAGPAAITGYTVQISKNNLFTQAVNTGNSATSSYVPAADLPKNLQLFWRVRTNGANGPSAWSSVRFFDSANSPTTPLLSLPTENTLNTNYLPLFKWSAITVPVGTTFKNYQVQVANNASFLSPEIDDSSITTITNILSAVQFTPSAPLAHNTKYYWRVRAVNTDDEAGNWSTVRTFRTIVDAPVLLSPDDGADPLTLRPSFDWNNVGGPGAVTYTIQISKNNTFTQIIHTGNPAVSGYIPVSDLPKKIALFWRVQAKGVNGPSAYSDVRVFTSANPPTAPSLSLPAANALSATLSPLFKWNTVTLPADTFFKHYQLQVADNSDFVSPAIDDSSIVTITNALSAVQFTPSTPLAQNTKYYWRVRAINTDDEEGPWSAVRYFRTIVNAPTLLSPANGSAAGSLMPVFDWSDATGPAAITNYTIQISASPTFATMLLNKTAPSSTYTQLTNLPAGKTIYWRVRVNGANGPSAWTTFSFTTP